MFKRHLRDQNFKSVKLDEKLKDVTDELNRHKNKLKKIEEYEKRRRELMKLSGINNPEELKNKIEKMESALKEYNKLKDEIEESKKIFKNLPKDDS